MKTSRILNLFSAVMLTVGFIPASSQAASATWNATPTNGFWEAAGAENNWSTGAATFPGALNATTNTDVATFLTSNTTTIAINSSAGNSSPLGIGGIVFGVSGSTPSAFTIGSGGANGGNSLLLDSGSNITFASGVTGTTTQIVNAPLVLQPASGILAGTYQFVNSSASTSALEINGNISGGTTTQGITLTLSGTNSNVGNVLSGVISNGAAAGNFSMTKANSGTWSLTGTNNSFTGGVRVDQGTLNVATISNTNSNSSIGSGGGLVFVAGGSGNATLNINGAGGETNRAITFNNNGSNHAIISSNATGANTVELSGNIAPGTVNTSNATIEFSGSNANANEVSGAIADNGVRLTSVTKSGSGTWILSSASNTFTGATTINSSGGTLAGIGQHAFGSTSGIAINGTTTVLSLLGDTSTAFTKASDSTTYAVTTGASGATINVDQATTSPTAKTMTIGTLALNNGAGANQTNFTGANNTSLSVGAVTTGTTSTSTNTETINNTNVGGGTLTLASLSVMRTGTPTVAFSGNGNTTISGAITEAAITRLTKSGSGTLTLSGNNSYTGLMTVSGGKLVVTDTIGSSAVTVSSSGTILATDTSATIGSTLAIQSGAILAVGDAANATTATATVVGATTLNNNSIFSWDINAAGTSYDKLISASVAGEVTAGDAVFRIVVADAAFANPFWDTNRTWTDIFTTNGSAPLANWATIFGNSVSVVNSSFTGITPVDGSFSVSGNTLTWSAVPEPTSALAGLLLGTGLLRRRRWA